MSTAATLKDDTVHVSDADTRVVLRPENNDLFVRTGKQVIEDCHLGVSLEVWLHEVDALQDHVRRWAEGRADRIARIYVVPRITKLVMFVMPAAPQFDFDLADEMAELNAQLAKTFNTGPTELFQVPAGELDRFVSGGKARLLYGGQAEPHSAMAT